MSWSQFRRQRLRQAHFLLAPETERLSQDVSSLSLFFNQAVSIPHSSTSVETIHPSVPAMARANLASRALFLGRSSQVQYGRAVRCDKLNAVGASAGPVAGEGRCGGEPETGTAVGRSSVTPDNLGRESSLRITGCARARGDLDTLCVDGDTDPDLRVIGGRRVGALAARPDEAETGGSILPPPCGNRAVTGERLKLMSRGGMSASVKYADALNSSSVL